MTGAALALGVVLATRTAAAAGGEAKWLGDDLPLPLQVKTPQDIGFKSATERQYLIFNLMAGGKLAYQRGDYAAAVDKWDTLLRMPGDRPADRAVVGPFLDDARVRAGQPAKPGAHVEPTHAEPEAAEPAINAGDKPVGEAHGHTGTTSAHRTYGTVTVSGTVSGGGQIGPGGAVIWLRRLDGPTPRTAPAANQIITQRDKTFLPHVLAVPVGSSVQFRNDDRIYHDVFFHRQAERVRRRHPGHGGDLQQGLQPPGRGRAALQHPLDDERLRAGGRLTALRQGPGLGSVRPARRGARALRALRLARGRLHDHPQVDHRWGGGGARPGGLGRWRQTAQPLRPRQVRSQTATATGGTEQYKNRGGRGDLAR